MSEGNKCYYVKRALQKDGIWFWSNKVYSGSALIEAGFSIDKLLSDYKIKVAKSTILKEVSSPDYYVFPQGEYEKELESAKRSLDKDESIKMNF